MSVDARSPHWWHAHDSAYLANVCTRTSAEARTSASTSLSMSRMRWRKRRTNSCMRARRSGVASSRSTALSTVARMAASLSLSAQPR